MDGQSEQTISEVTRRNIADALTVANFSWSGRMPESDFLARLYNVNDMPSYDPRYKSAAHDISKHMEMNRDWSDDWPFLHLKIRFVECPTKRYFRFREMVHPVVQPEQDKVGWVIDMLNVNLATDGWEIARGGEISGNWFRGTSPTQYWSRRKPGPADCRCPFWKPLLSQQNHANENSIRKDSGISDRVRQKSSSKRFARRCSLYVFSAIEWHERCRRSFASL